jgi:hypothetical protein
MNYNKWMEDLSVVVADLSGINLGYPQGENIVRRKTREKVIKIPSAYELTATDLAEFYNCCDGVSLPDVQNGYFIKSLSDLIEGFEKSEPRRLQGSMSNEIIVFGSTGGGNRFVQLQPNGMIVKLGNGFVKDRLFHATIESATIISQNFDDFLELLLGDVRAFVSADEAHLYIA